MHRKYGAIKQQMFSGLPDTVVELGPGPGANLRYYRRGTKLVAVEPNPLMHERLRRNADKHDVDLEIRSVGGEQMELDDSSAEAVIGTLVLCTVADPAQVLSEVHRVLKPGGRFTFLEHVAAPPGSLLRPLQRALHMPWHWLFEGCHLTRESSPQIEAAGFTEVTINRFDLQSPVFPIRPHISGYALK